MPSLKEITDCFALMKRLGIVSCEMELNSFLEVRYQVSHIVKFKDRPVLVDEINGIKIHT